MTKQHYNPQTNKVGICRARIKPCKFGRHFSTVEEAMNFQDTMNEFVSKNNIPNNVESYIKQKTKFLSSKNADYPVFDKDRTQLAELNSLLNGALKDVDSSKAFSDTIKNGGNTFNPITGKQPTSGFAFSPYPEYAETVPINEFSPDKIDQYANKYKTLMEKEGHYIGTWHDTSSGLVYLDVSVHSFDASHCRKLGDEKEQIAYFDFQTLSEVTIDRTNKGKVSTDNTQFSTEKFNKEQLGQIERGRKQDLDISIYARPEFDSWQMGKIRYGLERGLDVSIYAKPEFTFTQMEEIRKGLEQGLDVTIYANSNFNWLQMREIRLGLKNGIDPSNYAKSEFDWEEMEQMRLTLETWRAKAKRRKNEKTLY